MFATRGLERVVALDVDATRQSMEALGYVVFVLPHLGIVDRDSFFKAIQGTCPLDPPLVSSTSWDALSDSLWEGLHSHEARRIAILWPNTASMNDAASEDFELALRVLADVASSAADSNSTDPNPKDVVFTVQVSEVA